MIAQEIGAEGPPDAFSGALLLALGLRESSLRNVNNPAQTDHGVVQINEVWHGDWLRAQPGCPEETWKPVSGHTAVEDGYCPRFTPALIYALGLLQGHYAYATSRGIPEDKRLRFALDAYNAGRYWALRGYSEGDSAKYTTHGDYSHWILRHRTKVNRFLIANPRWQFGG